MARKNFYKTYTALLTKQVYLNLREIQNELFRKDLTITINDVIQGCIQIAKRKGFTNEEDLKEFNKLSMDELEEKYINKKTSN